MNRKRAAAALSTVLLAFLLAGTVNACSFDFSKRYECRNQNDVDMPDSGHFSDADTCDGVGGFNTGVDGGTAQDALPSDAGPDRSFPAWFVPALLGD